ncbi:uncharacterized protein VTP21DRAFT_7990 [Calcarisporiella thermophila]|uniref:uncharacterized protein n=1 Tax=Calcarisporiella thermophila TaxID=911321 RepID=UPI003743EC2D
MTRSNVWPFLLLCLYPLAANAQQMPPCVVAINNAQLWSLQSRASTVQVPFSTAEVQWKSMGDLPQAISNSYCVDAGDGKVFILGGSYGSSIVLDDLKCRAVASASSSSDTTSSSSFVLSAVSSSTESSSTWSSTTTTTTEEESTETQATETTKETKPWTPPPTSQPSTPPKPTDTPKPSPKPSNGETTKSQDKPNTSNEEKPTSPNGEKPPSPSPSAPKGNDGGQGQGQGTGNEKPNGVNLNLKLRKRSHRHPLVKRQSQVSLFYYDTTKNNLCQSPPITGEGVATLFPATAAVATMIDAKNMFIVAGYDGSLKTQTLDLATWKLSSIQESGQKPDKLAPGTAIGVYDKKIYLFGASAYSDSASDKFFYVYKFDLDLHVWTKLAVPANGVDMTKVVGAMGADKKMYLAPTQGNSSAIYVFDPAAENLTPLTVSSAGANSSPGGAGLSNARAVALNRQVAFVKGSGSGGNPAVYAFDTVKGEWTAQLNPGDASAPPSNGAGNGGKNVGAIAGGVVGSLVVIGVAVGLVIFFKRRRQNSDIVSMVLQEKTPFGRVSLQGTNKSNQGSTVGDLPMMLEERPEHYAMNLSSGGMNPHMQHPDPLQYHYAQIEALASSHPYQPPPQQQSNTHFDQRTERSSSDSRRGRVLASSEELWENYLFVNTVDIADQAAAAALDPHAPSGTLALHDYTLAEPDEPLCTADASLLRRALFHRTNDTMSLRFYLHEEAFSREVAFTNYLRSSFVLGSRNAYQVRSPFHIDYPYVMITEQTQYRLDHMIRSRPSFDDAMYCRLVARDLAQVLAFMHGKGVVHLSVEPAAFLSEGSDMTSWKIGGFQRARFVGEPVPDAIGAGSFVGAYSAPELFLSTPQQAHPSMDMWGLGALLYELCARQPLFASVEEARGALLLVEDDGTEALNRHWELPMDLASECDEMMREAILGLLRVDPQERFDGARVLRAIGSGSQWD